MPKQITSAKDIVKHILSGKAYFSMLSHKTEKRVTYKIIGRKSEPVRFVYTQGLDEFQFIGTIFLNKPKNSFWWSKNKSKFIKTDYRVIAFEWIWYKLNRDIPYPYAGIDFRIEGRCDRCHRLLIDMKRIKAGLGRRCKQIIDKMVGGK